MFERKYVFKPWRALDGTPADVGLGYEDVRLTAADGVRLHGWLIPGPRDMLVLFFHGNAGNMSHYKDYLRVLHDRLGASVFIFDYRGYGQSEGTPIERGLYRDAEAALRWVSAQPSPSLAGKRLVYFGRSLGTAVAIELALRHPPSAIILEAPLLSVRATTADRARWAVPLIFLLNTRFNSAAKIGRMHAPVFIAHGDMDETVPLRHGRRLFELANEPKVFRPIAGGGHREPYLAGGQAYLEALERFLEDADARQTAAA